MESATSQTILDSPPSGAGLVQRAKQLAASFIERAPAAEQNRRLHEETIADLQRAGFFRVLQPRRWGGFELNPSTFLDIQFALAEADVSIAWVYGNLAGLRAQMALLDDEAARDVWGEDSATLICCSTMRTGKATPVPGGFLLSGRWRYLSGCDFCDWALLGGNVPADGTTNEPRLFLVPRSEIHFLDNWHVAGLRATGSQDAIVHEAWVPAHRTHRYIDNFNCTGAGLKLNTSPCYRIPFGQIFFRATSVPMLGGLKAMLDLFIGYAADRVTAAGVRTAQDPAAQLICAEVAAAIDEIKIVMARNLQSLVACAERGETPPLIERMRHKFQSASVAERSSLLAARLFKAAGTAALFDELPFGRMLADINAARQHIANQFEMYGRNWGAALLGLEADADFFL